MSQNVMTSSYSNFSETYTMTGKEKRHITDLLSMINIRDTVENLPGDGDHLEPK